MRKESWIKMKSLKSAIALMSLGILAAAPNAKGDTAPVAVRSHTLVLEAEGESIEGVLCLPDDYGGSDFDTAVKESVAFLNNHREGDQ